MRVMSRKVIASSLGVLAAASAVGICAYVAFAPLVPKRVVTVTGTTATVRGSSASLVEAAGWPIVAALAVVVAICAAPLLWRSRTAFLAAAATLTVFSAVTWSTVGTYLLPLTGLLLAAGLVAPRRRHLRTSQPTPPESPPNDLAEMADTS